MDRRHYVLPDKQKDVCPLCQSEKHAGHREKIVLIDQNGHISARMTLAWHTKLPKAVRYRNDIYLLIGDAHKPSGSTPLYRREVVVEVREPWYPPNASEETAHAIMHNMFTNQVSTEHLHYDLFDHPGEGDQSSAKGDKGIP